MGERDQHLSHAACCRRHSALEDTGLYAAVGVMRERDQADRLLRWH